MDTHQSAHTSDLSQSSRENFSDYVAHLQLHMALQARKLVPTLSAAMDSRHELLHQTQADFEKIVSRQAFCSR